MRKIKVGLGGVVMLAAMLISDSGRVVAVYLLAALLHEIGHLLAAKALNMGIGEIRFELTGVRICPDGGIGSYTEEIILAGAGPLFSLLSAGAVMLSVLAGGHSVTELFQAAEQFWQHGDYARDSAIGICGFFFLSSLLQAATNLLPITGFDGGRMLYSLLARFVSLGAAERVLNITSALSAFVLWTVALYLMLKISAGLGIYVFAFTVFASTIGKREQ